MSTDIGDIALGMTETTATAVTLTAATVISLTAAGGVTIEGNNTSPNNSVFLHAPTGDIALDVDMGNIFISAEFPGRLVQLRNVSRYISGIEAGIILGTDNTCDVNVKGHLITSQAVSPSINATTPNYNIVQNSTDVAGMIDATAGAGESVQVDFREAYTTLIIHVSITAMNSDAVTAMTAGYFITPVIMGTAVGFTVTFSAPPTFTTGARFSYFVIDPVAN
jgi:hypothetical protein